MISIRSLLTAEVPVPRALVALGFTGAAVAVTTYMLMQRSQDEETEIRIVEKIEEVKRQYGVAKPKNPVELVDDLVKYDDETVDLVLSEAGYAKISDVKEFWSDKITARVTVIGDREPYTEEELAVIQEVEGMTEVAKNVFTDADPEEDDEWDMIWEIEHRDLDQPFIIHISEFEEPSDFEKVRLTYYEGDDVLVDERNTIVQNSSNYIGEGFLRFGHGSEDPNVVYIRNLHHDADFEITRVDGEFHDSVVHGYIKHEDARRKVSKHRVYDD